MAIAECLVQEAGDLLCYLRVLLHQEDTQKCLAWRIKLGGRGFGGGLATPADGGTFPGSCLIAKRRKLEPRHAVLPLIGLGDAPRVQNWVCPFPRQTSILQPTSNTAGESLIFG